jgi:hypothetical protein
MALSVVVGALKQSNSESSSQLGAAGKDLGFERHVNFRAS